MLRPLQIFIFLNNKKRLVRYRIVLRKHLFIVYFVILSSAETLHSRLNNCKRQLKAHNYCQKKETVLAEG